MIKETNKKIVLVIGGPTGSGETTVTNEIIKRFPIFARLVTATSRPSRSGEKDKKDYFFFSKEKFKEQISLGNIIEYTHVKNRDVYYGTYKPDLDEKIEKGLNVIVNVDIVGAKYYKKKYQATTIFIKPESVENLKDRLIKRDRNISEEELFKRLRNAEAEMRDEMPFYDYKIVNAEGKLSKAVEEIIDILRKEGYEILSRQEKTV